jgi:protein SCO1/2
MFPTSMRRAAVMTAIAAAMALSPPAFGHDHAQHGAAAKPAAPQTTRVNLTDTALLDQDGRSVRLKSDVMGDRIVVVGFIYTSCTTVCPVLSAVLAQTQAKLGARLSRDVGLVTVTVDPLRDTPARLKEYSARHGAGAGWTWLTGNKPQIDEVLKVFGAYTPNFIDHPPVVLAATQSPGSGCASTDLRAPSSCCRRWPS